MSISSIMFQKCILLSKQYFLESVFEVSNWSEQLKKIAEIKAYTGWHTKPNGNGINTFTNLIKIQDFTRKT